MMSRDSSVSIALSYRLDDRGSRVRFPAGARNFSLQHRVQESRDSSVGIALGYVLDDRGSRVRFPAGTGNFSLHHRVKNGPGAYPASYPVGTRGAFLGGKATGA
jgi:hypothetical protein